MKLSIRMKIRERTLRKLRDIAKEEAVRSRFSFDQLYDYAVRLERDLPLERVQPCMHVGIQHALAFNGPLPDARTLANVFKDERRCDSAR